MFLSYFWKPRVAAKLVVASRGNKNDGNGDAVGCDDSVSVCG